MGAVEDKPTVISLGSGIGPEPSGRVFVVEEKTYVNADYTKVVPKGDPEAAFLLAAAGHSIPIEQAIAVGLVSADEVADAPSSSDSLAVLAETLDREWDQLETAKEAFEQEKQKFADEVAEFRAQENAAPPEPDAGTLAAGDEDDHGTTDDNPAEGVSESTGDAAAESEAGSTDTGTEGQEEGGAKEKAKPADKAKDKPNTK